MRPVPKTRRPHKRTNNGCITCKQRHVRCDGRTPYCRNCSRLGKTCVSHLPNPTSSVLNTVTPLDAILHSQKHTQEFWVATHQPTADTIYYSAPHHRGIPSAALAIVQQSRSISLARSIPHQCLQTIARDYVPKYNYLASQYPCVKHALVSFAAYSVLQATGSRASHLICLQQGHLAIRDLQKQVQAFEGKNADAVFVASVAMGSAARDWDQWLVYVVAYSKILDRIGKEGVSTIFPDLVTPRFQLLRYDPTDTCDLGCGTDNHSNPAGNQLDLLRASIGNLKIMVDEAQWHASGFPELEGLVEHISKAFLLQTATAQFHHLALLRSWLFWLDLSSLFENEGLGKILRGYFYLLVLVATPLYPQGFAQRVAKVATCQTLQIQAEVEVEKLFECAFWHPC